jgi:hypothetical protein
VRGTIAVTDGAAVSLAHRRTEQSPNKETERKAEPGSFTEAVWPTKSCPNIPADSEPDGAALEQAELTAVKSTQPNPHGWTIARAHGFAFVRANAAAFAQAERSPHPPTHKCTNL